MQNMMRDAGFIEIEYRLLTLPLSGWSTSQLSRRGSTGIFVADERCQILETMPSVQLTEPMSIACSLHS